MSVPHLLRRLLPYLTIALIIGIAYDGWIFFSRWNDARQAEKSQLRKEAQDAQQTIDLLGGDRLKILDFYGPKAIRRGERATICYGVNEAERVRIEPPVEQLKPALSHCFQVAPVHDTEYKLIAEDHGGHAATATLSIKVTP